jgi:hypothetical protein
MPRAIHTAPRRHPRFFHGFSGSGHCDTRVSLPTFWLRVTVASRGKRAVGCHLAVIRFDKAPPIPVRLIVCSTDQVEKCVNEYGISIQERD